MALAALNENGDKVWIKFCDLEQDKPYLVYDCKQVQSKFDKTKNQTIVQLSCGFVALPARFNDLPNDQLAILKSKDMCIIKGATVSKSFRVKFIEKSSTDSYI